MTSYQYNHSNRLVSVSSGQTASQYRYNGAGDRVVQMTNGITTTYTLDLASGLTQVLADGAHTYLYGLGRISQHTASGYETFLGDALGSVRQLVNTDGKVTLERSYTPYGEPLSSNGKGASSYGFTGEAQENGLVFLRARYYSPAQGRFISRDIWEGNYEQPMSYNAWLYTYANPTNLIDPSGMAPLKICSSGNCPPEIDPVELRILDIRGKNYPDIDLNLDCPLPLNIIRLVVATLSVGVGSPSQTNQVVFMYDLEKVTRPVTFQDQDAMSATGELSVAARTVLVEETGARLLNNIHALADSAGIVFTAINRASNSMSYGCNSISTCMLRIGAYALAAAQFGWDPLCHGDYGNCNNAYGSKYPSEWLTAIDTAVVGYNLARLNLIADLTHGATDFAYTTIPNAGIAFYSSSDHRIDYRLAYIPCEDKVGNPCPVTDGYRKKVGIIEGVVLPNRKDYVKK